MGDSGAGDSINRRASRAFGWSFGNTIFSRFGTLAIGIALARVLGPEEFGVFAIASVALFAVLSFNELGVSLAVIRWRDDPATIAPTINTIAALSSVVLTLVMMVCAPWVAAGLGDVTATPVIQLLAASVLVNGIVATPAAILQREFMQRQRTIADQVNAWLGAIISLGLALLGWGAMSLAIGRLGASIVAGAMIWRWSPIRYRLGWDRQVAGRLLGFGLPLAASSVVVFASGFADQIIVGSTLGPQALGFYVLAFNLASWPVSIFSQPLRAVAPATFSALKGEPERMTRNFAKILTLLSCVAVPTCLAISGAAGPVISFVYGAAWLPAADVLLWLAAFAVLRIWFELSYDYLVVQGRSGTILLIQVLSIAVAVPAMLFAVREWGEAGVAAVQLVVGLVVAAPLYLFSLSRERIHVLAITKAVAVPLLAGVAVWVGSWMIAENVKGALLAAAAAASVAVAVIALLTLWQRDNVRLLRQSALGRTDK